LSNANIRRQGNLPAIANQYSGRLLIMGGARCVWDDLEALGEFNGDKMAINDIGSHYHGYIRHWTTLHPAYMKWWMDYRMGHNYGNRGHVQTHSFKHHPDIAHYWPLEDIGGSSGLAGILIGLLLGYSEIVLAGIPMDGSGHYFDPVKAKSGLLGSGNDQPWFWCRDNVFAGRVKSMSGKTRGWLGAP
jgi:hypothetical protein